MAARIVLPATASRQPLPWTVRAVVGLVVVLFVALLVALPIYFLWVPNPFSLDQRLALIGTAAAWFGGVLAVTAGVIAVFAYYGDLQRPNLEVVRRRDDDPHGLYLMLINTGRASAHGVVVSVSLNALVYQEKRLTTPAYSTHWTVDHPRDNGSTETVINWGGAAIVLYPGMSWKLPPIPFSGDVWDREANAPKRGRSIVKGNVTIWCTGGLPKEAQIHLPFGSAVIDSAAVPDVGAP